jgi:hypothetical protein
LTGLPGYPHPESLRRFLLQAEPDFREELHRVNDYLLQRGLFTNPIIARD